MRRQTAFTLIELLIVIAIIAILALIAIPNFLEAQVRAKIAGSYADLRAIATAIEAYTTDYSIAPLCFRDYSTAACVSTYTTAYGSTTAQLVSASLLTTPVAYLSKYPVDPFTMGGGTNEATGGIDARRGIPYKYEQYVSCKKWQTGQTDICRKLGYSWCVMGTGPTRNRAPYLCYALAGVVDQGKVDYPYDPSNGTVSTGLMMRTNKGAWTIPGQ